MGGSCASSESTVRTITASSLYAGTTAEMVPPYGASGPAASRLRARRAWSGAATARITPRSASSAMASPKAIPRNRRTALPTPNTSESAPETNAPGGAGGNSSARVSPVVSVGSAKASPRAWSPAAMSGSAATVAERSPPPSCSSTTLPAVALSSTRCAMSCASCCAKSSGSMSWPSVR